MTIEERMLRNDPADQVEVGDIVEKALQGSFGEILKQSIESLKAEYIEKSERTSAIPADRTLGIIQGLTALQERLNYIVLVKNRLKEEIKEEMVVK